ncbi:replicative DNA helicase [Granulosicoccaceae sp. 1_MG-2023]|nr:replicative DNA helicase [Granulosicoccaceae sp. 1_MG-2023]
MNDYFDARERNSDDRLESQLKAARTPPHSVEAEQAILGGLMLTERSGRSETAWDQIAGKVGEGDFYLASHRVIFRGISWLLEHEQRPDVVTLNDWLDKNELLEEAGGLEYLAALERETPSAANIVAYADIVRERSVLRQLVGVSNEIADAAYRPEGRSTKDLLDFAESRVFGIAEQNNTSQQGFKNIRPILADTVDKINELFSSSGGITGISTGFDDLDEMTSGFQRSDLIIVAGRPSMGKTTFSMNIAENVSLLNDGPVAVFSMEMPAEQLAMRMLASLGRVELRKIRAGTMGEADWPRLVSAVSLLDQKRNIFIDDTAGLSPTEVRARCRRLAREKGKLSLVVLDYLQLMQVSGKSENRTAEISEISRSLKALAKEMDVPVIALSQLNRSLEQRPDKRPVMSDLRESGAIEQDADVIMFVYRDEVYNPESPDKGTGEILIRKQRNGPTGSVRLTFMGQYTRFENFTPDVYGGGDDF